MANVEYIVSANGTISLYIKGGVKIPPISQDHVNYESIKEYVFKGGNDIAVIQQLCDIAIAITSYSEGKLTVEGGVVQYDGYVLDNTPMIDKLLSLMREGQSYSPLLKFIANLMENPSKRSIEQLYWFLNQHGLPITEDGCFIAYKAIDEKYLDKWTHTINNRVGEVVSVPRNQVVDDPAVACAQGLHCGSLSYAKGYGCYSGDRLVLVKVNPRDAVSVPRNECTDKLRVCRYEVVDDFTGDTELEGALYTTDGKRVEPNSLRKPFATPAVVGMFDNQSAPHWDNHPVEDDYDDDDSWEDDEEECCDYCGNELSGCTCDDEDEDEDEDDDWEDDDEDEDDEDECW